MIQTKERTALETAPPIVLPAPERRAPVTTPAADVSGADIANVIRRLILALVGFGVAMLGFSLMLTVFLVFIGLPLFIVGIAIMQAQES